MEPGLRRRLEETYGQGWLEKVNRRRRAEGRAPGRSLRDHRFCLAVFAYDPATEGWADERLRRNARVLIGLANSAAHDDVTDDDVARVEQIVAVFSEHYGVSPPSTFLPAATPPADPDPDPAPAPSERPPKKPDHDPAGDGARGTGARSRRAIRPSASSDRSDARRRVQRVLGPMSAARRGRWRWSEWPSTARHVGTGLLVMAAVAGAGVLVHAYGVAALLALPLIVVLALVLAALALYVLLWVVAVGGLSWAIYLFTQDDHLHAVLFLWLSVIAAAALVWLHEEVLS